MKKKKTSSPAMVASMLASFLVTSSKLDEI